MDRDTITLLTVAVMVYRQLRTMGIYDMPIEIKGLKAKSMLARGNIDRINSAYDKFNEAAPAHAADVEGLASQIGQHHEDLEFAASMLGNSTERLDEQSEQPRKTCEGCGGHEFYPFSEQTANGLKQGQRCASCSRIAWDAA